MTIKLNVNNVVTIIWWPSIVGQSRPLSEPSPVNTVLQRLSFLKSCPLFCFGARLQKPQMILNGMSHSKFQVAYSYYTHEDDTPENRSFVRLTTLVSFWNVDSCYTICMLPCLKCSMDGIPVSVGWNCRENWIKFLCHLYGNLIAFSTDVMFIEVGWDSDKMKIPMHLDWMSMAVALECYFHSIWMVFPWNSDKL